MYIEQSNCWNKKRASLVSDAEDFIITLEDGTKFCFIDVNIGKQIGLWND